MTKIDIQPKWSSVKPKDYYVYMHRKSNSTGTIFYVGKGQDNRAWIISGRTNPRWVRTAKKYGVSVEITQDCLTEDQAHLLEMWLIAKLRNDGVDLCNLTDGGEGASGWVPDQSWRDKRFQFMTGPDNKQRGKPMSDEQKALISRVRIENGTAKGDKNPRFGVQLSKETKDKIAETLSDKTIHRFCHKDHGIIECTLYQLRVRFNLVSGNLHSMKRGDQRTHRGWSFVK